ncbi:DEAD/DEAH box helicase (plasmid) [Azospirillum oryzae]|uniref:DEAD/DEAH box helicase n=1 Tax=Azospirillum oryzae TaxID=286727 RepID=A0A6N1AQW5_9PROT|nr:DEAD/DEAH box helicase [Azospirillum oryzae]KAA0587910.1 DEAD/DEAH box helicase [Azospirillum oryzae]QKS54026.1 DEAD/DEAH box helicase [Azospirillum oryzae]GLR77833.1 DEAD/DEAH box helicase [Azospirillum oryzae]
MLNELADRVWRNPKFQSELSVLVANRVRRSAIGTPPLSEATDEGMVVRLLQSATILAQSAKRVHREGAYRIATAAFTLHGGEFGGLHDLLYVVLSRLGNFPAMKLSHGVVEPPGTLPFPVMLEAVHRLDGNTVCIRDGLPGIALTDFQREVWDALDHGVSLGASAPTSAGKSYLLQAFIRRIWAAPRRPRVAYVVPTRALINQVSAELAESFHGDGFDDVTIITVPLSAGQEIPIDAPFVMTQERLQLILTVHPEIAFDFVIVDEAQSVGDGSRGVILTAVLEEMLRRNPRMQLFFACPNVSNPDVFGRLFALKNYRHHHSRDVTVAQNLIHLDRSDSNPLRVDVSLNRMGRKLPLGRLRLMEEVTTIRQATVRLSHMLGQGGQSLVYASGPSECQNLAAGLARLERAKAELEGAPEASEQRVQLSTFVKEGVHPQFALGDAVLAGVGFHYGAMPPPVRRAVEDAFRDGDLKFLVSTSTLLHGLNLPARSLFLNRPRRSSTTPLGAVDFWNLAGRAGRLGKEFEGDVYLIDYDQWENRPLEGEREAKIRPTLDEHIRDRELVAYISDPERKPDIKGNDPFENTFTKLFSDHRAGRLGVALDRLGVPPGAEVRTRLAEALAGAEALVTLDEGVIRANPTVSVYRQQRLYEHLVKIIDREGPERLMPIHPFNRGAYYRLADIFKICHDQIFQWRSKDRRHLRAAVFSLPWMRGDPLSRIIDANFKFEVKRTPLYTMDQAILVTLKTIETEVRFTYVRLAGCYATLLRRALLDRGYLQVAEHIVPIPLFLEMGACSDTMISFIGLGLSRISSRELTRVARRFDLGPSEAKAWIRGRDLSELGISPIIRREVNRVLGNG